MRAHLQHEDRQRQQRRDGEAAPERRRRRGAGVALAVAGVVGGDAPGLVPRVADRLLQRRGRDGAAGEADRGALGGQVDDGLGHAGHGLQPLFDARDAGGAGHALDGELGRVLRHGVAGGLDRLHHRRDVRRGRERHVGPFGGEVDRRRGDARRLRDRLLDPAHAGGAAHPFDGELKHIPGGSA
jgi:hypothetical protein